MLYLLVADGKRGAQVYFAAVTRDQAKLAHTDAEKMVAASPLLRKILTKTVNNLAFIEMGSFLRAISSEGRGLDGKRVHGALIDEEHEHPTDVVVSKMRRGTKGDQNALVLRVTNSGFDRLSVCWRDHEYSKRVLEGTVADESWFAFVCGLDPCAKCLSTGGEFPSEDCSNCDDWRTEGPHWLRACPNLGVSVPWQYYRDLVHQAKGRPDAVNGLLRFQFCVWTSGRTQGFDMTAWHACDGLLVPASELVGLKGYGGLDLGQTDDFSAFVGVWRLPDGRSVVRCRFWLPEGALEKYPNRPYAQWKRQGILTVVPGGVLSPLEIADDVHKTAVDWGLAEIAYDKTFAQDLARDLEGRGLVMVDCRQGFFLNEALVSLSTQVAKGQLAHGGHAILSWMAANSVFIPGRYGDVRLDKLSSKEKIDGIAALAMAESRVILRPEPPKFQMLFVGR
jgi:phage terminase large subunit-like protein